MHHERWDICRDLQQIYLQDSPRAAQQIEKAKTYGGFRRPPSDVLDLVMDQNAAALFLPLRLRWVTGRRVNLAGLRRLDVRQILASNSLRSIFACLPAAASFARDKPLSQSIFD